MMRRHPHAQPRLVGKAVVGLGLIALGAAFLLENLGLVPTGVLLQFWPTILVVLGLLRILDQGILQSLGGHLFILSGFGLQLACLERWTLLNRWWPAGVIWVGAILTLRALLPSKPPAPLDTPKAHEIIESAPLCQDDAKRSQ